jgi:hypothetical protein
MMDIVKKNVLSILCGVVILLSVLALFWPIGGMLAGAQEKANERLAVYNKLENLLPPKKQRSLPVVTLAQTEESKTPLQQFPGTKVIEAGTKATEQIAAQAASVEQAAVAMNQHALLVPMSLPMNTPNDRLAFEFRNAYRQMVREVLPIQVLRSTLPPTDKDLEDAEKKLWDEKYFEKLVYRTDTDEKTGEKIRTPLNKPQVDQQYTEEAARLPEKIRTERAAQFQMYVGQGGGGTGVGGVVGTQGGIVISEAIAGEGATATPTPAQIWYAQNALWVIQDVCQSIARVNATSKNTLESPVKHLISLTVPPDDTQYVLPAPAMAAAPLGEGESAPVVDPNAPIERKFDRSPTGRVCNPLYDVVKFQLVVNVDARTIPQLMQELSREKFFSGAVGNKQGSPATYITVNKVDLSGVNKAEALQAGFVYGEAPVVQLTLECEALFMRRWTAPLMPTAVQKLLGIAPAQPGGDGSQQASVY